MTSNARRLVGAVVALTLGAAPGANADTVLPDLVADAPGSIRLQYASPSSPPQLWLRFDGHVHNRGRGALEIRARQPEETAQGVLMRVLTQRLYAGTGHAPSPHVDQPIRGTVAYEATDGHDHFHLKDVVRYELIGADQRLVPAAFAKLDAGFCLRDNEAVDADGLIVPLYRSETTLPPDCGASLPGAPEVVMGVSPGWRDVYPAHLALQAIDVSAAAPGDYVLRANVDPLNVIAESDESNNVGVDAGARAVIVPGYRAAPGTAVVSGRSATVRLAAERYESTLRGAEPLGAAEFRIVTPPSHGQLLAPDGWFRDPYVTYVPDPGRHGSDVFEFVVRDVEHPALPAQPVPAQVRVDVRRR